MNLLTPLYLAGLAAVTLPILFHMIRRTPRGKVPFSTLMFLQESPPKVTSRSRIEHWLLLLLRAVAVVLLALAFGRPYLRSSADAELDDDARRVIVLVDVSASMQREDLWDQARGHVETLLSEIGADDELALYAFDRTTLPLLTFDEWQGLEPALRNEMALNRFAEIEPAWHGTDLGTVLPEAVTTLLDTDAESAIIRRAEVVVVSDLQQGSRLEGLQAYDWPEAVSIDIRQVRTKSLNNGAVQIVGHAADVDGLRVRVDNAEDSVGEEFSITSAQQTPAAASMPVTARRSGVVQVSSEQPAAATTATDPTATTSQVQVPPGQNRVVRIPDKAERTAPLHVALSGDDHEFDNHAWHVPPLPRLVVVKYHGDGTDSDPNSLRYYVQNALISTPAREIVFVTADEDFVTAGQSMPVNLVARALDESVLAAVKEQVAAGALVVVAGYSTDIVRQAFELAGLAAPELSEAQVDDYAMLSDVDLSHALFAPFNDARLADFTRLPVFHYRAIGRLPTAADDKSSDRIRVLARLDGTAPAILELRSEGDGDTSAARPADDSSNGDEDSLPRSVPGRVVLFTFGWQGDDSQFVLWSKFLPLINGLLEEPEDIAPSATRLVVGDRLPIERFLRRATGGVRVTSPAGTDIEVTQARDPRLLSAEPGVYGISIPTADGPQTAQLAVNLDPLESRTAPLGLDQLRAAGFPLTVDREIARTTEERRQLQARELESRQRFWQWVLLAGIVILLLETWLAGLLTRRPATAP